LPLRAVWTEGAGAPLACTMRKPRRPNPAALPPVNFALAAAQKGTLQQKIRQKIVDAILAGLYPPGRPLPSSRKLSRQLGVARNTVVLAYQQLVEDGHLVARKGSGIYVNAAAEAGRPRFERIGGPAEQFPATDWAHRFKNKAPGHDAYRFPPDWQRYPYPFIEGRFDRSLFPVAEWREATRLALGVREIEQWSTDTGEIDDPLLVEQIRTKVLPRRGIDARADEILITLGTQQGLHLLTTLLVDRTTRVVVEEPGSVAMRKLLATRGASVVHQLVDQDGMVIDTWLDGCRIAYVTPSHQRPTGATMSLARRRALLDKAALRDFVIIEDDFECETNYLEGAPPALRGMAGGDRVIYVGNLSRVLLPSLRLGFLVAAPEVISEARQLRALTTRHPPLNNQRTAALFLSLGHYDAMMTRLARVFHERLIALRDALNHYRPHDVAIAPVRGGTAYWIRGPEGLDARDLARHAEARGVLIEPVGHYYATAGGPPNVFRMGISAIPQSGIRSGVNVLADVIRELAAGAIPGVDSRARLKGPALRKAFQGATLLYKTVYGEPCTIELHQDGSMDGRAGYANEERDTGRWWVEKDCWCRQWDNWAYGEVSRFYTAVERDRVQWFNMDGRLVDSAVLAIPPKRAGRPRARG
jgi:GntR family transcriptional regulator / MocR family aminotransferase